jgi:acyl-CoA synthetase (AMP-forming)/AMP-acid ligase II
MTCPVPLLDQFPPSAAMTDLRNGRHLTVETIRGVVADRARDFATAMADRRGPLVVAEAEGAEALISLFAAWGAGRMAVMVNPGLAPPERRNVIAHSQAAGWVSGGGSIEPVSDGPAGEAQPEPLGADAPCLMMMTSGTTGTPKGILHSPRSLQTRVALNIAHIGAQALERSLCVLPVFFGHGLIGNCLTPLAAGGHLHLLNGPQAPEIARFGATIDENGIGFMSSVPSFWRMALRAARPEAGTLERIHVGSAPLSADLWRSIAAWSGGADVYNMFGMTETANWIGGAPLTEADGRDGHVGRIWGGVYAIRGEDGGVHAEGRGEVLVSSPSIMLGYSGSESLTRDAFDGGWFRTGDIGELTEDGSLTLVGRMKTEINRGGIKILAEEIDMMLERHPDVEEACAFGIADPAAGEAVAAAVVLRPGSSTDTAEIRRWCRGEVRAEGVPVRLVAVDAIPRNERGKIVRSAVRDAVLDIGGR